VLTVTAILELNILGTLHGAARFSISGGELGSHSPICNDFSILHLNAALRQASSGVHYWETAANGTQTGKFTTARAALHPRFQGSQRALGRVSDQGKHGTMVGRETRHARSRNCARSVPRRLRATRRRLHSNGRDVGAGKELTFENNWIPNRGWAAPTFVTIRLSPALAGTLVELFHHGFEHAGYETGWGMTQLNALKQI